MAQAVSKYSRARFRIEIDGIARNGFQKCSGLEQGTDTTVHRESNSIVGEKSPGLFAAEPITLEFGAADDVELYEWHRLAVDPESGLMAQEGYKKDISIVQLDDMGEEVERWNVFQAWVPKYKAGEWDATSGEKTIRSMTIEYDYYVAG